MNRRSFFGILGITPVAAVVAGKNLDAARAPGLMFAKDAYVLAWPLLGEKDLVKSALCLLGVLAPGEEPSKADRGFVSMQIVDSDTPDSLAAKIAPAFNVGVARYYSDEVLEVQRA